MSNEFDVHNLFRKEDETQIINQQMKEEQDTSLQYQTELFRDIPLVIYEITGFNTGSVQASKIALAEDGGEYVLKGINDGDDDAIAQLEAKFQQKILKEMSPVAEFFCHKIADLCGLPIPQYRILIDKDDVLYFGSLLDKGHVARSHIVLLNIIENSANVTELFFIQLWTIYAFDCFFFNTDRHLNNYLVIRQKEFVYTQIKPIDFGFSSFSFVGYPYKPMYISSTDCNTRNIMSKIDLLLQKNQSYSQNRQKYINHAKEQLNKLLNINQSKIKEVIESIPEQWMNEEQKKQFIEWWGSDEKRKRIITIQQTELK